MAQRNNPARRVPGNPLAGIIRALNQQSRYAARNRRNVPTVTSQPVPELSIEPGSLDTDPEIPPVTEGGMLLQVPPEPVAASADVATGVAAAGGGQVAVAVTDATGVAKVAFEPFESQPVVTVTATGFGPVLPVIEDVSQDGVAVVAYDVTTGARVAGVTLHVAATEPETDAVS